jgi:hypothetical protein
MILFSLIRNATGSLLWINRASCRSWWFRTLLASNGPNLWPSWWASPFVQVSKRRPSWPCTKRWEWAWIWLDGANHSARYWSTNKIENHKLRSKTRSTPHRLKAKGEINEHDRGYMLLHELYGYWRLWNGPCGWECVGGMCYKAKSLGGFT